MSRRADELKCWIQSCEAGIGLMNWFLMRQKSTYLPRFKMFCDGAKKNPDELIELKIEGLRASLLGYD